MPANNSNNCFKVVLRFRQQRMREGGSPIIRGPFFGLVLKGCWSWKVDLFNHKYLDAIRPLGFFDRVFWQIGSRMSAVLLNVILLANIFVTFAVVVKRQYNYEEQQPTVGLTWSSAYSLFRNPASPATLNMPKLLSNAHPTLPSLFESRLTVNFNISQMSCLGILSVNMFATSKELN